MSTCDCLLTDISSFVWDVLLWELHVTVSLWITDSCCS